MDRALPFSQTAGELQLVRGEDEADQVAQQPPAIFLGGVDGLVPLLVGDEERIVLQQLFAALQGSIGINNYYYYYYYYTSFRVYSCI